MKHLQNPAARAIPRSRPTAPFAKRKGARANEVMRAGDARGGRVSPARGGNAEGKGGPNHPLDYP